MVEYMESLYELLLDTELDLEYARCILDGSWPSSVQQLNVALENAKLKAKNEII